jgi:hypothetical protein
MSHVRTQIRDRFVTLLGPVGTVHASRIYPLAEDALPVLLVYTNNETIDVDGAAFNALDRSLEVVVEIVEQATATLDTALDTLLASVEAAIGADEDLNGLALHAAPASIEVSMSTEGAQPIGRARLTYSVLYRTTYTDPTVVY